MTNPTMIAPDPGIAAKLTASFALNDILCVSLSATNTPGSEVSRLSYDLPQIPVGWLMDARELAVVLPFKMEVFGNDDADKKPIALFEVVMRVSYMLVSESVPSNIDIAHYAGVMGYMHTWPYFRADIQYLTTKLGFPALVLPVVLSGDVPKRVLISEEPIPKPIPRAKDVDLSGADRAAEPARASAKKKRARSAKSAI